MKKQKKQMIFMLLVLVVLLVGYVLLQRYNASKEEAAVTDTTEQLFDQFGSDTDSSQVTEISYYVGEELCNFVKKRMSGRQKRIKS